MYDDPSDAFRGSRRLRREVGSSNRFLGQQMSTPSAEAGLNRLDGIDPNRFPSLYRDRMRDEVENAKRRQAAQGAPYGSIAQRQDPERFGSIASRTGRGLRR